MTSEGGGEGRGETGGVYMMRGKYPVLAEPGTCTDGGGGVAGLQHHRGTCHCSGATRHPPTTTIAAVTGQMEGRPAHGAGARVRPNYPGARTSQDQPGSDWELPVFGVTLPASRLL